jgi:hypothetical protein
MDNKELRIKVLLSLQVALLGKISPNIRGITCSWDFSKIIIRCIFHGKIDEEDRDSMEIACTEVMADFPDHDVEIEYLRADASESLNKFVLMAWVYCRKE